MPNLEISTQIIEAPLATEAALEDGNLHLQIAVQSNGEPVLRHFHIGTEGQKKILDALTGGLTITDRMP